MTIDEAIEALSYIVVDQPYGFRDEPYEAIRLGIEALKRVKAQRKEPFAFAKALLPGETEKWG